MLRKILITIFFCTVASSALNAQLPRHENFIYDFDTSKFGCTSPEDLGNIFFKTLQQGDSVQKLFANQDVFGYMITNAGRKNSDVGVLTVFHFWKEFEEQRNIYVKQLYDNIRSNNIDMKNAWLDTVKCEVEPILGQEGKVNAADIEIIFSHAGDQYSIFLDDCGQVKRKWFIMTPYILWQGKVEAENGKQ